MDIEKAGYYKLYTCRSLLACDSGGTVYDTSQRLENFDSSTLSKNADNSPSEPSLLENIIYIVDKDDNRVESSLLNQSTVTDENFCQDEFDSCKPCSNAHYEFNSIKDEPPSPDDSYKYYIVQCNDTDSPENSTLDSDTFDKENFEYYCDSIDVSSPVEDNCINSSNNDTISGKLFIHDQEEAQFHTLPNSPQETEESLDLQDLDEAANYSVLHQEIQPIVEHTRKRKQSYSIKSNSFTEFMKDQDSSDAFPVSGNSKKKKTNSSKVPERSELQFHEYNPFENLKMSSILKKEAINQIQAKNGARESFASTSDEEGSELSNYSYGDKIFSDRPCSSKFSSHFSSTDRFLKIFDIPVKLNSDLTNANYLEYVQPREKIVESDMDKLLSPTIEVEISTVMQHCQINECVQEAQGQVDCNGNDVNLRENLNHSLNSNTSARKTVEKELVSKALYAVKLGYQNIFNTSNECVIEEILYDSSFSYRNIQLEINSTHESPQPKIPFVLLENVDHYLTFKHHHQLKDPFRNVSCSLKDTLNELKHFGGFAEDNCHVEDEIKEPSNPFIQSKPAYTSFNSLVAANLVQSDINANYDSKNNQVPNTSINEKELIAPLKMRIKRVGDDNQYVIDDSRIDHAPVLDKATSRFQKNPDSKYECSCCLEKFRTKKLLKSHISENHKGPYDMECEICHMKSKKSSAYKKHKPWCAKSTALKCEICNKVYCYKAVLLRHLNTHKD